MKKQKKSIFAKIIELIILFILIVSVFYSYNFYQKNNLNEFDISEANLYTSEFVRDSEEKYSKSDSYKIFSKDYNDAMYSENVKVKKNTPYKVTCMVKTENVEIEEENTGIGAQICISDTTERSVAIQGTSNWQKIEFLFDSKNRDNVNIGFRLGGYLGQCKGTVWFSDFTIEEGANDGNTKWNFACVIYKNINVKIDNKDVKLSITDEDYKDIKQTVDRLDNTFSELSEGKMTAKIDTYVIDEPLNSLSYDDKYGYYVSPEDVENQISDVINKNNYDHIYIVVRLGNEEHNNDILINDWIGLGSMDYHGIGFSNIRLPNTSSSYLYKYDEKRNLFPEEVFVHEFLHSLERTLIEYGYDIPALHDNQKYGYKIENLYGLKKWYTDYMNQEISTFNSKDIGLDKIVYSLKPAKETNFNNSLKLEEFKEPENIIDEIELIINKIKKNLEIYIGKE